MKSTMNLLSIADRMEDKYGLGKIANPNNLSYKLIDLVQEILRRKHGDPVYAAPNVQRAMGRAVDAMNSLIMELTSGKRLTGVDPVEVNKYD